MVKSETFFSEGKIEHTKESQEDYLLRLLIKIINFCVLSLKLFLHLAFEETLQHPDLKVDLGLCAVNLAVQHKR